MGSKPKDESFSSDSFLALLHKDKVSDTSTIQGRTDNRGSHESEVFRGGGVVSLGCWAFILCPSNRD